MFKWVGEGKIISRWGNKELHYWAFQHGNLQIKCGDYVLIHNNKNLYPEDVYCCLVAQIKDLFDTGNITQNPYRAVVQWYSRITDIPLCHQLHLPSVDYKQELIQEGRQEWSTNVNAETIFGKCTIILLKEDVPTELYLDTFDSNGDPLFYCKWKYNGLKFEPISASDNLCISVQESVIPSSKSKIENIGIKHLLTYPPSSSEEENRKSSQETEIIVSPKRVSQNCLETETSVYPMKSEKRKQQKRELSNCTLKRIPRPKNMDVKAEIEPVLSSNNYCDSETSKLLLSSNSECHQQCIDSPIKLTLSTSLESKHRNEDVSSSKVCSPPYKNNFLTIPSLDIFSSKKLNEMMNCTVKLKVLDLCIKSELLGSHSEEVIENNCKILPGALLENHVKKFKPIQETRYGRKVHPVKIFNGDWKETLKRENKMRRRVEFDVHDKEVSQSNFSSDTEDLYMPSDNDGVSSGSCSDYDDDHKTPHVIRKRRNWKRNKNKYSKKTTMKKKFDSFKSMSSLHNALLLELPSRNGLLKMPLNSLEAAREKLHVCAVPESLSCREHQFSDIYAFIKGKLLDGTGGCMYISGVPGTGKTATVFSVLRTLKNEEESGDLPEFNFVEINGMRITEPHQCYVQILKALTGQKAKAEHATELLQEYFTGKGCRKETVVIMIDELDLLWTPKQSVLYNLFDWPLHSKSNLIIIAIANTMDLPERMMKNRVISRLGLTRMTFQPYSYKQLQEIILSRMKTSKFPDPFDPDAIQLAARKVAAISGDARRVLDICRRATEIAEEEVVKPNPKKGHLIRIAHVEKALQEMFSSPMIIAMRSSSLHERIFLKSLVAEFQRTGVEEATFACVLKQHIAYCRLEGILPPTTSEAISICVRLGDCHILLMENGYCDIHQRIRLNVNADDVRYALTES